MFDLIGSYIPCCRNSHGEECLEQYIQDSPTPICNDGFSWRKYGQKKIKTSSHQRLESIKERVFLCFCSVLLTEFIFTGVTIVAPMPKTETATLQRGCNRSKTVLLCTEQLMSENTSVRLMHFCSLMKILLTVPR